MTAHIEWELTQGQVALINIEDWPKIEQHKWCATWNSGTKSYYAVTNIKLNGKWTTMRMSRLIMGLGDGKSDKRKVDHKDHNTLDNRKNNLRVVSNQQNEQNKSNVKGYTWHKLAKKWAAKITVNYKTINLGLFDTEEKARNAYLSARKTHNFLEVS
jgi:hypothetical protein